MTGGSSGEHEASERPYAATLNGVREAAERIAAHAHVTPVRDMRAPPYRLPAHEAGSPGPIRDQVWLMRLPLHARSSGACAFAAGTAVLSGLANLRPSSPAQVMTCSHADELAGRQLIFKCEVFQKRCAPAQLRNTFALMWYPPQDAIGPICELGVCCCTQAGNVALTSVKSPSLGLRIRRPASDARAC